MEFRCNSYEFCIQIVRTCRYMYLYHIHTTLSHNSSSKSSVTNVWMPSRTYVSLIQWLLHGSWKYRSVIFHRWQTKHRVKMWKKGKKKKRRGRWRKRAPGSELDGNEPRSWLQSHRLSSLCELFPAVPIVQKSLENRHVSTRGVLINRPVSIALILYYIIPRVKFLKLTLRKVVQFQSFSDGWDKLFHRLAFNSLNPRSVSYK